jgi:dienelactone hydrolase
VSGYRVVMPVLYGKMERETKGLPYDPRAICASWSIDADALGTSLLGARLFDATLAYRFARQRPDVDGERIACIGLSMGGELSLYLAAIEPEIRVCVSAGFPSTFGSLLLELGNC